MFQLFRDFCWNQYAPAFCDTNVTKFDDYHTFFLPTSTSPVRNVSRESVKYAFALHIWSLLEQFRNTFNLWTIAQSRTMKISLYFSWIPLILPLVRSWRFTTRTLWMLLSDFEHNASAKCIIFNLKLSSESIIYSSGCFQTMYLKKYKFYRRFR